MTPSPVRRLAALVTAGLVVVAALPLTAVAAVAPTPAPSGREAQVRTIGGSYASVPRRSRIVAARLPRAARRASGLPRSAAFPTTGPRLAASDASGSTGSTGRVRARVPLAPGSAPVLAASNAAGSAVLPGTQGVSSGSQGTNDDPPAPAVAAGPDAVVEAVNQTVRILSRAAGDAGTDVLLRDFFGLPALTSTGPWSSSPQVIFDSVQRRWIASEVSWDCKPGSVDGAAAATYGHGYLDIAISDSDDPMGGWSVFYRQYVDRFPADPGLGSSLAYVVQNANVYQMSAPGGSQTDCRGSSYRGADFTVFDWVDVTNGGGLTAWQGAPQSDLFGIRTAVQAAPTLKTGRWLGYQVNAPNDFDWVLGSVTGSVAGNTIQTTSAVTTVVGPPVAPATPKEPNGDVSDAIDGRITSVVQQGNRLVTTSTYGCKPDAVTTRACVRVTELAISDGSAVQDFLVGATGEDDYAGAAALAGNGSLHVVWTRSSASAGAFPSAMTAYQRTSDAADSISDPQLLAAGTQDHGDGSGGAAWSARAGVAQDPQTADGVWQASEYASSSGTADWSTFVSQLRQPGTGLRYVPITPVRVLDTRNGTGLSGSFAANTARAFQVTGVGGIPAGAKAVTGNVTVVSQSASGYVSVTPTATNIPATSTLNFPTGDVRANNVTATLGSGGKLGAVYRAASGAHTHIVFDVTGYYLSDASKATYTPITPLRVLDSRDGTGLSGPFVTAQARSLVVADGGSIPADAVAVTGNLTVVGQQAKGYISVVPSDPGTAAPAVSNLNFPVKDVRANGVTAPVGAGGAIWIVYRATGSTTATTNVVFDVTGYFRNAGGGAEFHPLAPGRVMDTRTAHGIAGQLLSQEPATLTIADHVAVSSDAVAITGNLTVVNQAKSGYISVLTDVPVSTPTTSTLNFPVGDTRANGITSPLDASGRAVLEYVAATHGTGTDAVLDITGYFE